MNKSPEFLVVIGASAGGLTALSELVRHLPARLDVGYCVVLHMAKTSMGDYIIRKLSQANTLPCKQVEDDMPIEAGTIYIARPNCHMLVKENKFMLGGGPEENRWRPSIDVLFRSAAIAYGSKAIGIILTGFMDDGTSGMWAIKRCGGRCIVQDPDQAEYPDMPLSVINNMEVDAIGAPSGMGKLIAGMIDQPAADPVSVPADLLIESAIAEKTAVGMELVSKIAELTPLACPDCGGGLWEMSGDIVPRYRCHIGHAYSQKDLILKQSETSVSTLWVALRMLEERSHLLRKMESGYRHKGYKALADQTAEKQTKIKGHVDVMKAMLNDLQLLQS